MKQVPVKTEAKVLAVKEDRETQSLEQVKPVRADPIVAKAAQETKEVPETEAQAKEAPEAAKATAP